MEAESYADHGDVVGQRQPGEAKSFGLGSNGKEVIVGDTDETDPELHGGG